MSTHRHTNTRTNKTGDWQNSSVEGFFACKDVKKGGRLRRQTNCASTASRSLPRSCLLGYGEDEVATFCLMFESLLFVVVFVSYFLALIHHLTDEFSQNVRGKNALNHQILRPLRWKFRVDLNNCG